ncbi:MAG: lysylphosphatidylglycerol synthase transmembrane domain-containing protein [Acidobacteriota bacterium]
MKRHLRNWAAYLLGVALLALWLGTLDRAELARALTEARWELLVLALLLSAVQAPLRAWRWGHLLPTTDQHARPRYLDLLDSTAIGFMVSFTLPGRIGEVLRPVLVSRRSGRPLGSCFSSILVERVLDILTLLVVLLTFAVFGPRVLPEGLTLQLGLAFGLLLLCGLVAVWWLPRGGDRLARLTAPLARRLPERWQARLGDLASSALQGLSDVRQGGAAWRLPLLSVLTWAPSAVIYMLVCHAVGIELTPIASLLLLGLGSLGIAVPTPAGIGGFHGAITHGLVGLLGAESGPAGAAAFLSHLCLVVPVILHGLFVTFRSGLGIGNLRELTRPPTPAEEPS